ncbi:CaiB/BaiF CoA-transferase family protein [Leifsonia sp. H3M29-4]|uniref:CaiB/BaiF CoA transferase family protein n=1 Tax=Salinibacterium metalliresistens TaxID=3031321 RepID=UPI0023DAE4A5|nr:CaiB/BaiF CoA-transferase family protein [Salinibacterium metalliresistens]MDF1480366.1 CaiB/BaiF CoA-transferase family protein [Salinibacterium metalliresistens]
MTLPLDGITVIALEQAVAAPFASRQLADLGARVIKIERGTGDFARGYDDKVNGLASYFVWLNRGKESVVLDLKDPADFALLTAMVREADVLIQNLVPGAVDRLGLSAEAALELNPKLIFASISGYGAGGAYEDKKAYDLLIQCESGLLSVTGMPDNPAKVGISIADIAAGMYAYSGILAALINRGRTGRGDILEISMLEAMGEWMSQPLYYAMYGGQAPERSGPQHASIAPYGPFPVSDGTVFLAVQNEREWAHFCSDLLGQPALATDPRFSSNTERVANRPLLHEIIEAALGGSSVVEVLTKLDEAQIANAQLRTMLELADHPQLHQRGRWREIGSPVGDISVLLPPVSGRELEVTLGTIPELGAHTDAVKAEFQARRRQ